MNDINYMRLALEEAKVAFSLNEVPIGALIVKDGKIISKYYNRKSLDNIATYHAEVLVIEEACKVLGTWYLDDCILYTTVEPCMMCTGAIIQARIPKVVYKATNNAFGYLSKIDTKIEVIGGILEEECSNILREFFKKRRQENLTNS